MAFLKTIFHIRKLINYSRRGKSAATRDISGLMLVSRRFRDLSDSCNRLGEAEKFESQNLIDILDKNIFIQPRKLV